MTRTNTPLAKPQRWELAAVLLASLVVQLGLAAVARGYPYDTNCFFAWALRMEEIGPAGFYVEDYFCDYPPGYLLLLWFVGKAMKLLKLNYTQKAAQVLLCFLPSVCGAGIALVVYRLARQSGGHKTALRYAAAAAFLPVILFDTAVWKQIDAVFALLMLLCFALLAAKHWMLAALFYGLALAVKPQALLAGPALAVCYLWPLVFAKTDGERWHASKNGVLGAVVALAPPLLCGLPFWGLRGLVAGITEKYGTTAASYPYATINACNLMSALGGEWTSQTGRAQLANRPLPFTWQQMGTVLLVALTVYLVVLAVRAWRKERFCPLLLAAVYAIGVFTLGHRMHERYLLFGAVLLLGAAARFCSRDLLLLAEGFSLTSLLNLAQVYCVVGTDDEFLNSALSDIMLRWVGIAQVALFVALAVLAWRLCGGEDYERLALPEEVPPPAAPEGQPAWTRREALALLGLTAVVAVVSFAYLGDTTAPQTCLDANGDRLGFVFTVAPCEEVASLWVYTGISTSGQGSLQVEREDGELLIKQDVNYGNPFCWLKLPLSGMGPFVITVDDCQIFELCFRAPDGRKVALLRDTPAQLSAANSELFDEQALVPDTVSQLNSFYFDEIYHARTAYESLHGMRIYETTHPPLGKDLIALGVALFGMTAFGWRFSGTLCGVLMIPAVYWLTRRLCRKPRWALFAAALLGVDFMRFSQSRIATIDSFSSLFILLGACCMVWYCQTVLEKGVNAALLPMALGGLAFGCGCASKWTGLYAGVGLAVCYFGVLWQRGRQLLPQEGDRFKKEVLTALGGGVAFYVLVPLFIYIQSYWPYKLHDPSFDLAEWWRWQQYMLRYHSGLEATHPFSSCWYSWLLDLRPVWYYMGSGLPQDTFASIAGFFNPVVCWGGLLALLMLGARAVTGRASGGAKGLLVFYLCQLLPWILVTRCTFLYHYMPCLAFFVSGTALCFAAWEQARPAPQPAVAPASKKKGKAKAKQAPAAGLALSPAVLTAIGMLSAACVLFVWFYPALTGLPVSRAWAASLKWLSSWGFYIL